MARSGIGTLRKKEQRWARAEALDLILTTRGSSQRLAALAAIGLWRTLTAEHLAAIVGKPELGQPRSLDLDLLWAAGLIQKGRMTTGMMPGLAQPGGRRIPMMYRPDPYAPLDALSLRLSYAEWLGVTAGRPWATGSQFVRHNLLATELSIRVAEYCDIGTVFGESLAAWWMMADQAGLPASSKRAADAVWVRPDGLVVAVEITASTDTNLVNKVRAWAELLSHDPTRNLVVVFVEAAHPDRRGTADLWVRLRRIVSQAATSSMDVALAGVGQRMAVARWEDWFPSLGQVSTAFMALRAERPTGPERSGSDGADGSRWEPVDLLDPFDLTAVDTNENGRPEVLVNADLLFGLPHWLRKGSGQDLRPMVLDRAGFAPKPKSEG